MAIEAVVSVVIEKLTHMLEEEPVTLNKLIVDQLEVIRKELEKMSGFLIDAEDRKETNEAWAQKYLLVLYDVEDEIEKFALRVARQRKRLGFLMNHALFFNNLNACRKLRRKMKRIRTTIKKLNDGKPDQVQDASVRSIVSLSSKADEPLQDYQGRISINCVDFVEDQEQEKETESDTSFSDPESDLLPPEMKAHNRRFSVPTLQTVTNGTAPQLRGAAQSVRSRTKSSCFGERQRQARLMYSYSYDEELGIFGFKEDVNTLVDRLHAQDSDIVPVVGVEGSGKTTLARAIYGKRNVKHFFERRAWFSMSEEYTKRDIWLSLLKQLGCLKDQDALMSDKVLENRLSEHFNEKRSLVVLDNVRTCNVWEELRVAFADTRNDSKVIFTTHDIGVVKYANPHVLERLSDDDSWDMFLKKANWEETSPLPNPNDLKSEILRVCNGIPLNIVLLGGLLSTKDVNSYREWPKKLLTQANWRTLDILLLCYNDLPVHQKLCLLYLVLFPKEFDISVRRLLRLLLAEGFVKHSPQKFPEDVVEEYFVDLVNRNLIWISKNRSDGNPKKCRLLGVLHDYLLPKAQHIRLFHLHRSGGVAVKGPFGVRRMIEYGDIRSFQCDPSKLRHLRSYLSFNFPKKDTPAKEVGKFLSNIIANGFGLLRVLDLERVHKPSLPDNLGVLYQLRYLGLRWTFLDSLPPSVGDLPYLETLDVKHTYITSLPSSIWKLKHLRHLNLNYGTRVDVPTQSHGPPTLLTLWGLFVDHDSPVKDGLSRLRDLRELGLTFHLTSSDAAVLVDWIANLTALQSLRLRSKDEAGRPSRINLMPFSSLEKLLHLNLLGNLQKLPEFPRNIKVLTLSVSMLKDDPMPTLGQLPSLTVLRLLANSYQGEKLFCSGFLKLRVLKLWMLKELKDWDVEQGAMPNLKELNIRCCDRLKSIPHSLLRTLDELILTNMPEVITAHVKKEKAKHTSLTLNKWDFTPLPWEQDATTQIET